MRPARGGSLEADAATGSVSIYYTGLDGLVTVTTTGAGSFVSSVSVSVTMSIVPHLLDDIPFRIS